MSLPDVACDNIILIGMPSVGKSTVGVILAERIGFSYIDTDIYLQVREGRRLHEIIAADGIDTFCDIEADHIRTLDCRRHVIATGGSVVYRQAAMDWLRRLGVIVHLDLPPDRLAERIGDIDQRGVVYAGGQSLPDLYAERRPLYSRFEDLRVDCNGKSPERIAAEIVDAINTQTRTKGEPDG